MKGKWKNIILYSILFLLFIYTSLNIYDYFFIKAKNKILAPSIYSNENDKNNIILNYGDFIEGLKLRDVTGEILNITETNQKFKVISISELSNTSKFNLDQISWINDIKNNIYYDDIEFIKLYVGELSKKAKKELAKIQNKYIIKIASIKRNELLDKLSVPNCKCGFVFLLDKENNIRFSNPGIDSKTFTYIIKNEIDK